MTAPMHAGRTSSLWRDTADMPAFKPLTEDTACDVCVVGAGIAGLTTAYHLAKEGVSVIVLDDGPIAGGETERTTAHAVNALDDRYAELERIHGQELTRLAAESHTAAIDRIERIATEEKIDCDFRRLDGYLFAPIGEKKDILQEELEATRRMGIQTTLVEKAPLKDFDTGEALRFPDQATFDAGKYMAGLAKAVAEAGGVLHTGTHAEEIAEGAEITVTIRGGKTVRCAHVVVATNAPVNDNVQIYAKQAPYRTYVVAVELPRGEAPDILLWDTLDPYHYVRIHRLDGRTDLLIVGGEDHKTGHAEDMEERWRRLETWTRVRFPSAGKTRRKWSGQVMEPADGLAMIGRLPGGGENSYVITGDSGNGITHGTLGAMLVTDLIAGRKNPWEEVYDPARLRLKAAPELLREGMTVAQDYADWVTPGDEDSVRAIPKDGGAVIRDGLEKVAVYRDRDGALHKCSAVCPHRGCIVRWNDGEKSWDCPCHGSRFSSLGAVLNGPSISDLRQMD